MTGSRITAECRSEMVRHRKFLMEDYRLSPEVVTRCSDDIENFCRSLEVGGKTIHCLMEHSRPKRRRQKIVSVGCQRAVRIFPHREIHLYRILSIFVISTAGKFIENHRRRS